VTNPPASLTERQRGRTVSRVRLLGPEDRVRELGRMLSGRPESVAARRLAEELLADAGARRGRD